MAEAVQVEIRAAIGVFQQQMAEAARTLSATAKQMGTSFGDIKPGTENAKGGIEGFLGTLKEFRQEQVQQGRQAKFFAAEITSLIPAAGGAGSAMQGLVGLFIEGASGGLGFGLALEAVKLGIGFITASTEAAKKAIEEADKRVKAIVDEWEKRIESLNRKLMVLRGGEKAGIVFDLKLDLKKLDGEIADAKKRLSEATYYWTADAIRAEIEDMKKKKMEILKAANTAVKTQGTIEKEDKAQKDAEEAKRKKEEAEKKAVEDAKRRAEEKKQIELQHQTFLAQLEMEGLEGKKKLWAEEETQIAQLAARAEKLTAKQVEEELAAIRAGTARKIALWEDEAKQKAARQAEENRKLHEQDMKQIEEDYQKAIKPIENMQKELTSSLAGNWNAAMQQLMAGQLTFAGFVKSIFRGLLDAVVGFLTKMVAEWAAAAVVEAVIGKTSSVGSALRNQAVAASGAAAAMASVPFVGPGLAAAAAASMMALTAPFVAQAGIAYGGADLGSFTGVKPMFLHSEEMVLPAKIANPLRDSLDGGGFGGGMNVTIHAVDAKSVERLFKDNASGLIKVMKEINRNGRTT